MCSPRLSRLQLGHRPDLADSPAGEDKIKAAASAPSQGSQLGVLDKCVLHQR